MFLDGLDSCWPSFRLTDHAHKSGFIQHHLGKFIHARGSGWTRRADHFIANGIYRADIIYKTICEIDAIG